MSENYEQRSPEQLQRDIERTRAEMGDTLDTIRRKLSPGQLLDEALDYLKSSSPGQFTNNLGESVKQNPLPVSLIGIGIAWLALAGSRAPYVASPWTTADRTHSRVGEAAGSVAAKSGQAMHETRERVGEMAHMARAQVGEAASRVRDQTQYQAARARDTYNYLRTEQPLILGILALAVGAAFGAGLPPTRQEDALLGEMRDEYVHRVKDAGEEYLEQGRQMTTAASDAAKEQTERTGLTDTEPRYRSTEEKRPGVSQPSRPSPTPQV
jgi:ElaB/YqjD/DUF883 family membrane-anchored ribosome-binding protein